MSSAASGAMSTGRTPGRDRTNARGDATREAIILVAERMFAERGIEAVPLRAIGIAAGQKNNAVVQYHFGDRDSLVEAIAAYRARDVEAAATELVADLASGAKQPHIVENVKLFVHSLARNIEPGNYYLPFLARYIIERGDIYGLSGSLPPSTVATLQLILRRLLPDIPEAVLQERWQILMTSAVHTLARYQLSLARGTLTEPLDDLLDDLVEFLTAGLSAPWPPGKDRSNDS